MRLTVDWAPEKKRWLPASAVHAGDRLRNLFEAAVDVTAVGVYNRHQQVHNLTIAGFHTYRVVADNTAILVHNGCEDGLGPGVRGGVSNLRDGAQMAIDDALDTAVEFLGPKYRDMGDGRYLSEDGLRQVRMTDRDLVHPRQNPHLNFET